MLAGPLLCLLFPPLFSAVLGQDLSIPQTWQQPMALETREDYICIATAGLDLTHSSYFTNIHQSGTPAGTFTGFSLSQSADMLWTMALKDRITGAGDNPVVKAAINIFGKNRQDFQSNVKNDTKFLLTPVTWGMASMMAYIAYNDSDMLQAAESAWNHVSLYQITQAQADSGSHPLRPGVKLAPRCQGMSIAGAVFTEETQSLDAEAITINRFILLSSHLAEKTQNPTYSDAAKLSANFVAKQLLNGNHFVERNFTLGTDTQPCQVTTIGPLKIPNVSGEYIEALSVLGQQNVDPNWQQTILQVLGTTLKHDWNATDEGSGVMGDAFADTVDEKQYKGKYVRSLYETLNRTDNAGLRKLIAAFVNVQANSILQHATRNDTNFYSSDWTGPANSSASVAGALASLDVLVTAIGLPNNANASDPGSSSDSGSSSTLPKNAASPGRSNLPLVIGLGVGIPIWAILTSAGVWCIIQRRRRQTRHRGEKSDGPYKHFEMSLRTSPASKSPFTLDQLEMQPQSLINEAHSPESPKAKPLTSTSPSNTMDLSEMRLPSLTQQSSAPESLDVQPPQLPFLVIDPKATVNSLVSPHLPQVTSPDQAFSPTQTPTEVFGRRKGLSTQKLVTVTDGDDRADEPPPMYQDSLSRSSKYVSRRYT